MSTIAVKGIPAKFSLLDVVKSVAKLVAGPFEPLNFIASKYGFKTCYLRLSERLDPVRVVQKINTATKGPKGHKFTAFIPQHVPDLPLLEKRHRIPMKLRDSLKIPELELPHEVITNAHNEVFMELQYKYPGLYNLSKKTEHKLLDELARIIGDRLKHIMETNPDTRDSCFKLSKCYRKTHPHFGDFQLILSTLHRLQDATGAPRAQVNEAELAAVSMQPYVIQNIPLDKVKTACKKYSNRVVGAIKSHVAALDSEISPGDNEETVARKKVREELKKMLPYLPAALKQVIATHFIPEEQPFRRIRIYGEPFLPARDAMLPFTRRYNTGKTRFIRSNRMYNLLMFKVEDSQYAALRAMDATVINGAKLTIRSSDIPLREVLPSLRAELAAHFGGTPGEVLPMEEDDEEPEEEEDSEWQDVVN